MRVTLSLGAVLTLVTCAATPQARPDTASVSLAPDAGTDFSRSDDAEGRVLRRRQSEDTLDRGMREWDQAVVQGRNTRATACAAVKKMRFPAEGITTPVIVTVPVELADGGPGGEVEVVVLPDGTVQSCR